MSTEKTFQLAVTVVILAIVGYFTYGITRPSGPDHAKEKMRICIESGGSFLNYDDCIKVQCVP